MNGRAHNSGFVKTQCTIRMEPNNFTKNISVRDFNISNRLPNFNLFSFVLVNISWKIYKVRVRHTLKSIKVTSTSKHTMPYLTKKVAQLTKKLSLTSIFSCCLQLSSLSIPAMFVDLKTPEWSARRQRPEQKKLVCRKYIIYAHDIDMNIRQTRLKRK